MLPGPIFNIELLTSARRTRFYWIRVIYAGVLLLTLWSEYPGTFGTHHSLPVGQMANFAAAFFGSFSIIQILTVLLVGPALVAPTVSVERERRTIEYLFASDLSNAEIVLGKLLARVLLIGYAVLVGLPILALAGLLGGIEPERLLVTFIITVSTMLSVAALSITVSVVAARVRDALAWVYVMLLAALTVPLIAKEVLTHYGYYDWVSLLNERLVEANPLWALAHVMQRRLATISPWPVVASLVANQLAFATLLIAGATWSVRRVHLRASDSKRRWQPQWRRGPMTDRPMLWKEQAENSFASCGLGARIVLGLLLVGLAWVIGWSLIEDIQAERIRGYRREEFQAISIGILSLAFCGALLLVATRAAASVTGEREKDTWLGVLSTPLAAREIVVAKILGNLYPARFLLLLWAVITVLRVIRMPSTSVSIPSSLVTGSILMLFCSTLGTYVSLVARSTTRALSTTVGILVFLGGGYMFCCAPLAFFNGPGGGSEIILAPCAPMLVWVGLALGANFFEFGRNDMFGMFVAYVVGTIGYGVATAILFNRAVGRFDEINGRVRTGGPENLSDRPDERSRLLSTSPADVKAVAETIARPSGSDLAEVEVIDDSTGDVKTNVSDQPNS